MGRGLHGQLGHAALDGCAERTERGQRACVWAEPGEGELARGCEKHGVQHVDGEVPPLGLQRERVLGPNGKVELGAERVEDQVDLVQQRNPVFLGRPQLDHVGQLVRQQRVRPEPFCHLRGLVPLRPQRGPGEAEEGRGALDRLEEVDVLEHERLDGLWGGDDDSALGPGAAELGRQGLDVGNRVGGLGAAVKGERVDPLGDDV